jgi:monovalent cation:H+ antiporter-2, CPA2 family
MPSTSPHVIVAGFGVPGRAVVEMLHDAGISYCIVELNRATVERCEKFGEHIIEGDVVEADVLRQAGIERATIVVIAIPNDQAALIATKLARSLNPTTRIVTRCHFTSKGLEAKMLGADEVIVEEQAVAKELISLLRSAIGAPAKE